MTRIDQNYQLDKYGIALMMIREGCSDPAGLARRILSEFEKSSGDATVTDRLFDAGEKKDVGNG